MEDFQGIPHLTPSSALYQNGSRGTVPQAKLVWCGAWHSMQVSRLISDIKCAVGYSRNGTNKDVGPSPYLGSIMLHKGVKLHIFAFAYILFLEILLG
jgi:hypothetical protein